MWGGRITSVCGPATLITFPYTRSATQRTFLASLLPHLRDVPLALRPLWPRPWHHHRDAHVRGVCPHGTSVNDDPIEAQGDHAPGGLCRPTSLARCTGLRRSSKEGVGAMPATEPGSSTHLWNFNVAVGLSHSWICFGRAKPCAVYL
jgi:hypothetical protein